MQDIRAKLIYSGYFISYFLGVIILLPPESFHIKMLLILTGLTFLMSYGRYTIRVSSPILLFLILMWLSAGFLLPLKYKTFLCHFYFLFLILSILPLESGKILKISIWALLVISVVGLLQAFSIIPAPVDNYGYRDFSSVMGLSNYSAHYIGPLLIPVIWYGIRDKKWLWILTSAFTLIYLILIKNRALLFALWGTLLFVLITLRNRKLRVLSIFIYAIISIALIFSPPVKKIISLKDYSARFRYFTYIDTLKLILHHPLGVEGRFEETFPEYISYQFDKQLYTSHTYVNNPHSELLYWGADFGIIGILFYLFLWFQVLKKFFRSGDKVITLGLLTALFQSLVDFNFHTPAGGLIFFSLYFSTAEEPIRVIKSKTFTAAALTFMTFCIFLSVLLSYGEFMYRTGKFFLSEGKRKVALQYFKKSLEVWPYNWNALTLEGLIYKKLGFYELAEEKLSLAIRYNPAEVTAMKHIGIIFARKGEIDKTFKIWLRAMKYSPYQRVKIARKLVKLLVKTGKYEKLKEIATKFPQLLEKVPELRYYLKKQ